MSDKIKPSRTDTFEHTIAGLLTKRSMLFNEAERIRDRLAEIRNDIQALDRVLGTLGYTGDLDAEMPRCERMAGLVAKRSCQRRRSFAFDGSRFRERSARSDWE